MGGNEYSSPEMILSGTYDLSTDVFSFGHPTFFLSV